MATKQSKKLPKPGPFQKKLEILVGRWKTRGTVKGEAGELEVRLKATDTYEWLPGGFFLLHHVDGHMGSAKVKSIEVIGYDADRGTYITHAFDNYGSTGRYAATLKGMIWRIVGETERFSGAFEKAGTRLKGKWERKVGAKWRPWIELTLKKR